ncbi:thiamine pyrophosphate-dependent dehydrogenase E1 component subunit alpha [Dysosmobacter sp.]|uniref:thiamine pyrophosphate-dependent dehydrogenase E1 component subunit alpha n=1 Tax=Dysosmobacter sp. TaxID=2591382 RepID=UPI002A8C1C0E|nr:thiamine pyrophosphate-dependent dehydrogenase E1 component subunit alpha [Dysosmobacter sp.]MDY3282586.1 thiamine pyrophosphate-dependent dehydrogenase E1 component subunit alpha [Dysosmobacter sp.]
MLDYQTLNLTRQDLADMYRTMRLIRRFEETAVDYFKQGIVIGNMHMYVGEEAVATGVCKALTREDYIASSHRCDGHLIAKGADINAMMAELMGKENGCCGGRAGKMHQTAPEVGFMSANGIVGASQTLGAGHALYCSLFAPERIAVSFFGDGGGNQGGFHESMNLAAVWKLPVVFVCENNHYAISTRVDTSTALSSFYQRAAGYGIPGVRVNGNDALEVYAAAKEAVDRARRGEGPSLIECDTYRYRGHHEGDEQTYRTREEVEAVRKQNDCIQRMLKVLTEDFGWTEEEDQALIQSVEQQIAGAVEFGLQGAPMKVEDMEKNLFAE